jgi:hypothetical protein
LVLPQLSLTLTNAVIVTATVPRAFPAAASRANERNWHHPRGWQKLLCPFGAMRCATCRRVAGSIPLRCRTGLAPIILGSAVLVLAVGFSIMRRGVFAMIPIGAVGRC